MHGGYMTPRDDEKGNFDDTEFPPDSENNENGHTRSGSHAHDAGKKRDTDDEGDYDDKDQ